MVYGYFKDLTRRTASNKVLCDKAFSIPKTPKYDRYQRGIASIISKVFIKKNHLVETLQLHVFRS